MMLLDYLAASTTAFYSTLFVVGLAVGSFLNVVIYRLPRRMEQEWKKECRALLALEQPEAAGNFGLVHPRSRCPQCGHAISPLENIPVLSYLLLRGRCSECRCRIPVRYPVVELLTAVCTLLVAWRFGYGAQVAAACLLTWSLIALSGIDLDFRLLPDDITLPLLWLGILCNMFGLFVGIRSSLVGVMAGYLLLWGVYRIFKLATGKEGMGHGDFKLLAMLGAWLGWQMIPLIIVLSSTVGAVIGVGAIILRRRERSEPIPFGPYLAAAGFVALLWGPQMTAAYLRWTMGG